MRPGNPGLFLFNDAPDTVSGGIFLTGFDKPGERAVIGFFHISREKTSRYLLSLTMVFDAFTALAAAFTVIGTGAFCFIGFNTAFDHFC